MNLASFRAQRIFHPLSSEPLKRFTSKRALLVAGLSVVSTSCGQSSSTGSEVTSQPSVSATTATPLPSNVPPGVGTTGSATPPATTGSTGATVPPTGGSSGTSEPLPPSATTAMTSGPDRNSTLATEDGIDTAGSSGSTLNETMGPNGSSAPVDSSAPPATTCVPNGRAHNPLVTHIFTADPNAVVYGDRVYVYMSHDVDGQDGFDMVDYRGFSSSDMVNWQDHGVLIHASSLPWATNLYAPGACAKNGKYYLYMPNSGSGIGVAAADDPGGPFVDPLGQALLTKSFPNANVPWLFDPACFVDDDGQAYLYFGGGDDGGQNARVVRLNDDMVSIKDASATTIPTTAFFEASFMHKHDGTYFFSYSSDFSSEHGAALEYLTSNDPMTGFTYKGKFLPNHNINNGNNNHGSIVDFKDKTYLFYHARKLQQELGVDKVNNRSVAVQEITYGAGGVLNQVQMSTEDFTVTQLECLNGFSEVEAENLAAENGIEVEGNAGGTVRVAQIGNGDWVGYSQVDFRNGATKLVLQIASAAARGSIDVRIDGCITGDAGTSVGTCAVDTTGGANTFAELSCDIDAPAGAHDLCLHFAGEPEFQLDSWHLE